MSDQNTLQIIKRKFSEYYRTAKFNLPSRFGSREWGIMPFEGQFRRHLAFKSRKELVEFLVRTAPASVYHSSAYYERPGAPTMKDKNWLGADLIFDLDADHIKGVENLTYEEMLTKVKTEFRKLLDEFILSDLGFDPAHVRIVFSGGRGYHIHISDPKILSASSAERREILDYIRGTGLDYDWVFPTEAFDKREVRARVRVRSKRLMPTRAAKGWRKKMRQGIELSTYELERLGRETAIKLLSSTDNVSVKLAEGIYTDLFDGVPGKRGVDRLRAEANLEVFSNDQRRDGFLQFVKEHVSVEVRGETDEPVTSDVHRVIRMPESLHGKTGFKVVPLSLDELADFDPLRDAIVFSDTPLKVNISVPVSIRLKGEHFKLVPGTTEVPEFVGMFLLCRRQATLVDKSGN
jgi:DNA primase small subunit